MPFNCVCPMSGLLCVMCLVALSGNATPFITSWKMLSSVVCALPWTLERLSVALGMFCAIPFNPFFGFLAYLSALFGFLRCPTIDFWQRGYSRYRLKLVCISIPFCLPPEGVLAVPRKSTHGRGSLIT